MAHPATGVPVEAPTGVDEADDPGRGRRPEASSRLWAWVRRVLLANLIAQIGIVMTGGVVRVSQSGLGCPTWPRCVAGSLTPVVRQAEGFHKYIEFGNRLLTSVVSLTAVAVLVMSILVVMSTGASRRWIGWGALPSILVATQAVLGGITVLTGLSPATVAGHFLVSMVLVAASTWLLVVMSPSRLGTATLRPEVTTAPAQVSPWIRGLALIVAAVTTAVLMLGTVVTGAGPHSGDSRPRGRFDVDLWLIGRVHAAAVLTLLTLVVVLLVLVRRAGPAQPLVRRVQVLLLVTLAQGALGYGQSVTGLPEAAVVTHMLGAALMVVAVAVVVTEVVRRPPGS